MKAHKKKVLATLFFSVIAAIVLIVHGIFFDLDFKQIERLTIQGFSLTFVLVFLGLLLMEKLFNLDEDEEIVKLKKKVSSLEKKEKKLERRLRK